MSEEATNVRNVFTADSALVATEGTTHVKVRQFLPRTRVNKLFLENITPPRDLILGVILNVV